MIGAGVVRLLAAFFLTAATTGARAAHPLITEDTGTQGRGRHQIEFNSDRAWFDDSSTQVASLTYSYGARERLDVIANLPATLTSPSGINDASLRAKWRFAESENASLAIMPELILPTGNENRGLGAGKASMAFTLLASHDLGPWTFHGNIGLLLNRYKAAPAEAAGRRTVWRASAAAVYEFTARLRGAADIGIAQNPEKTAGRHPASLVLGVIYSPSNDLDLDVGLKTGLTSAEADRQVGAGVTFRF